MATKSTLTIYQASLVMRTGVFLGIALAFAGCEIANTLPRSKLRKTDVPSAQKGGPSAEVSISFFSSTLRDEAQGKPAARAWGTYEDYWKSRMQYIASNESKAYYDRVFRDFNDARLRLGLLAIVVRPYESYHETK